MADCAHTIIIGSGPAGLTAALYAARAGYAPLVIQGTNPGGQLMRTGTVENWPGERAIFGPHLIQKLIDHVQSFGAQIISGEVIRVDFKKDTFELVTSKEKKICSRTVIIASGAQARMLGCPGEKEYWGKGVTVCAVCDGALYKDLPVVIVGGGDTALEDAAYMAHLTNNVTLVHVHEKFKSTAHLQDRVLTNKNIRVLYNSAITQVTGDGNTLTHVTVTHTKTGQAEELPAHALFLAIGQVPSTAFLINHVKLAQTGHVIVQKGTTATSVPGIFACGDVIDTRYRQAITAAASGCMAALDVQKYLEKLFT